MRAVLLGAVALLLAACGEAATVTGVVKDNFGKPAAGATVSVNNDRATAVTDAEGHFEVAYKVGTFDATIGGEGYATGKYTIRLRPPPGGAPVEAVIQRLPPHEGLYVVTTDGYKAINSCTFRPIVYGDPPETSYQITHAIPTVFPGVPRYDMKTFLYYGGAEPEVLGQISRVRSGPEFYLTRAPDTVRGGRIVVEESHAAEIRPEFPIAGRWFNATFGNGIFVFAGRLPAVPPDGVIAPDPNGPCFVMAIGDPGTTWVNEQLTREMITAYIDKVKTCLPPLTDADIRRQIVTLKVPLNHEGGVAGPAVATFPPDAQLGGGSQAAAMQAVATAIAACGPYTMLPPDLYTAWRELSVTFDLEELLGG